MLKQFVSTVSALAAIVAAAAGCGAGCGVRMTNEKRGLDLSGRYWVNGGQLYAQFGQGSPTTYTWSVSPDGRLLYLDGRSYIKAS